MFYKEVAEKAKAGRGIHNRASRKKGFKGGIRFPHDNMSRAERKKLNGVCIVSNIYDTIITYEAWKELNDADRVKYLTEYVVRHGTGKVAEVWEKPSRVYDNMRKYGIVNPNGRAVIQKQRKAKIGDEVAVEKEDSRNYVAENRELNGKLLDAYRQIDELTALVRSLKQEPSFSIGLSGIYNGEAISGGILKMVDVLEADKEYDIKLNISEK